MYHMPVLINEVIANLNCTDEGIYLDATLGGGGYSEAILKATSPKGKVLGFDRDKDAIIESKKRLAKYSDRFDAHQINFSNLESKLEELNIEQVQGVVADLGVSSHQLDDSDRGFSFTNNGVLDMRMNRESELSALEIVNQSKEKDLADLFYEYGEERLSRRVARLIVEERRREKIVSTGRLAEIVKRSYPAKLRRARIHPATKVFQALRIVVNNELEELSEFIKKIPVFLASGGRLIIVSYHSLEDRIVKRAFVELDNSGSYKRIVKKPIRPTDEEVMENRRARSARMRVLEKI